MVESDVAVDRDRLADQAGGYVVAAPLVRHHAEKMQAVGMAGGGRENQPVEPLGLVQVSRLVMAQGFGNHPLGDGPWSPHSRRGLSVFGPTLFTVHLLFRNVPKGD